jgi:SAM-dependent methyltransferase
VAELTTPAEVSSCCSPQAQSTCCEPAAKADCCTPEATNCGCGASATADADIREAVRERYAAAAAAAGTGCCDPATRTADATGEEVFGAALYGEDAADAPDAALAASLGCGVPTAVADLRPGETVDVLISARRVGPTGKAIGIDMTDEMLALARANAEAAGVENVEFIKGHLEALPLPDASVDVIISNCVINLAADKAVVISEAARVLRPGGRFAASDVIADPGLDDATRADVAAWTGCIAGALTEAQFAAALHAAGFDEIDICATHPVHQRANAAIIRAAKPR